MHNRLTWWLPVLGIALAGGAAATTPQSGTGATPTVSYARTFKGSQPYFFKITVAENDQAVFEEQEHESDPVVKLSYTASPRAEQQVFSVARQLQRFSGLDLDNHDNKVAYTGTKTLSYDGEDGHGTANFNYTSDARATGLEQLFERIASTGDHAVRLMRIARFDHLGVPAEIDSIDQDWRAKALAETQLLVPVLQQASSNTALMSGARNHAARLAKAMTARQ